MPHLLKKVRPESCLKYIVYHPIQIILLITLITLLFALQIPSLRFETSIYDLTIEDLPETLEYYQFKEEFGCEEIILVVAKTKGVFHPETFRQIDRLAQSLSQIDGIRRVISLPGIRKAMDITGKWDLSDFEGVVSDIDLFHKNLISEDKKTTVITLVLEDIKQKDQIINGVKGLLDEYQASFSLYQIGMPIVSSALARFTQQDFLTLPVVTFSLIALILFLFFRNLRGGTDSFRRCPHLPDLDLRAYGLDRNPPLLIDHDRSCFPDRRGNSLLHVYFPGVLFLHQDIRLSSGGILPML